MCKFGTMECKFMAKAQNIEMNGTLKLFMAYISELVKAPVE